MNNDSEQLVKIDLKNGRHITFHRDAEKNVILCSEEHCVIIPHGTGNLTTQLFALLEPLGETILPEDKDG